MIEPRASRQILHRRDLSTSSAIQILDTPESISQPSSPIHPDLEYESLPSSEFDENASVESRKSERSLDLKLLASFVALVLFGSSHLVLAKLQAIPMYNYPIFLNLFSNLLYIPLCFAYILPVARFGWFNEAIDEAQLRLPARPFVVMGALDSLATTMQVLASVYLPGHLLVLLPQVAIPLSMLLSRSVLGERHSWRQYAAAAIVMAGLGVVMEPLVSHRHSSEYYCEAQTTTVEDFCTVCQGEQTEDGCLAHRIDSTLSFARRLMDSNNTWTDDWIDQAACQWLPFEQASREEEVLTLIWSVVMIASTVPMTLSSLYKQIAVGDGIELDPIFLNGWVAVYQLAFSMFLAIPAGWFTSPAVSISALPRNLWHGLRCYFGFSSIEAGCHPDALCDLFAALFVNLCLVCNFFYTLSVMLVLKYGTAAYLFLALALTLPLGNLAFGLALVPGSSTFYVSDLVALTIITGGLLVYRWGSELPEVLDDVAEQECESEDAIQALIREELSVRRWTEDMLALRQPLMSGDV